MSRIKSLASDTLIYGVFTITGRFITFMLTPLYTNYLTMSEFGEQANIFSILAFINIIYSFGMDSAFFRFYSKDDFENNKRVFTLSYLSIFLTALVLSLLIFIFAGSIAPGITDLKNGKLIIRLACLIPLFDVSVTVPYALLRITRRAFRFAMTRFVMIIIAVTLNFLFLVEFGWGLTGVFLAQLIATVTCALVFLPEIFKYFSFSFDKKLFWQMIRFGLPTLPATMSTMILQVADRPLLRLLTSPAQVGMYNANHRLGIPMMLIVSVFEYAWKPFYLSRYEDPDAKQLFARILTYFTIACGFFFLATAFFIGFIVRMPFIGGRFINPAYWSGMGLIPIILAGYYFNGVFNNFAAGFQITKKTEYLPLAVGSAAVINICLNLLLIPVLGIWGAGWSMLIAYFSSSVLLYILTRKVYPVNYEWWRIFKVAAIIVVLYLLINNLAGEMYSLSGFAIRFAGILGFFLLLWIFRVMTKGEINRIKQLVSKGEKNRIIN